MVHDRIRDSYPTLSRSYRSVADYIVINQFDVAFMTATQLAAAVKVNTTTVVRFAQALGYTGYPDMLEAIRQRVRAEVHAARGEQPVDGSAPGAEAESSAPSRFRARLAAEQEALTRAQAHVHNPPQEIEAAVALLAEADRFVFVAEGEAIPVAMLAAQQLGQWGFPASVASGDLMQRATALAQLAPGDLVIGLGTSAQDEATARSMHFARSIGCPVLAVVNESGAVSRAGDRVIHAPGGGAVPLLAVVSALLWVACGPEEGQMVVGPEVERALRFLGEA